jgi:hypothetical protein
VPAVVILSKNHYFDGHLETCILHFFQYWKYDWVVNTRSEASTVKYGINKETGDSKKLSSFINELSLKTTKSTLLYTQRSKRNCRTPHIKVKLPCAELIKHYGMNAYRGVDNIFLTSALAGGEW